MSDEVKKGGAGSGQKGHVTEHPEAYHSRTLKVHQEARQKMENARHHAKQAISTSKSKYINGDQLKTPEQHEEHKNIANQKIKEYHDAHAAHVEAHNEHQHATNLMLSHFKNNMKKSEDDLEKGGAGSGQKGHTTHHYEPAKIPGYKFTHSVHRDDAPVPNVSHHYESDRGPSDWSDEAHHDKLHDAAKKHYGDHDLGNGLKANKIMGSSVSEDNKTGKHEFEVTLSKHPPKVNLHKSEPSTPKLIYKAQAKPYTQDLNDLIEAEEIEKGRGPDKSQRAKRGEARAKALTESNLKHVAQTKQSQAIKDGQQRSKANRLQSESVAQSTEARKQARMNKSYTEDINDLVEYEILTKGGAGSGQKGHQSNRQPLPGSGAILEKIRAARARHKSETDPQKKAKHAADIKTHVEAYDKLNPHLADPIEKGGPGSGVKGHQTSRPEARIIDGFLDSYDGESLGSVKEVRSMLHNRATDGSWGSTFAQKVRDGDAAANKVLDSAAEEIHEYVNHDVKKS